MEVNPMNRRTRGSFYAWIAGGLCLMLLPASAGAIEIVVDFDDDAGEGFYDPLLGAQRRAGFQRAMDVWTGHLTSTGTIHVQTCFSSLGGTATSAVLGRAGPTWVFANFDRAPERSTWYAASLADTLAGQDLKPGQPDVFIEFNADVDGAVLGGMDWHYGTDVAGGDDVDFQTVAMHEMGHGLGFFTSFRSDGSWGYFGMPATYDRFLVDASGRRLIDKPTSVSNVTQPVFFDGPAARAAYAEVGGEGPVPIYAPPTFQVGSSISHVDEETFTGLLGLMSPFYDQGLRDIDPVVLGILDDMGWTVDYESVVPEPGTLALLGAGLGLVALRRRSGAAWSLRG